MKAPCPWCRGSGKMDAPVSMSERLAYFRVRTGMPMQVLALKTGIPLSTLWRYETGVTPKVPVERARDIATVLGIGIDQLVG